MSDALTVAELIEELRKMPQGLPVYFPDAEYSYAADQDIKADVRGVLIYPPTGRIKCARVVIGHANLREFRDGREAGWLDAK